MLLPLFRWLLRLLSFALGVVSDEFADESEFMVNARNGLLDWDTSQIRIGRR